MKFTITITPEFNAFEYAYDCPKDPPPGISIAKEICEHTSTYVQAGKKYNVITKSITSKSIPEPSKKENQFWGGAPEIAFIVEKYSSKIKDGWYVSRIPGSKKIVWISKVGNKCHLFVSAPRESHKGETALFFKEAA